MYYGVNLKYCVDYLKIINFVMLIFFNFNVSKFVFMREREKNFFLGCLGKFI